MRRKDLHLRRNKVDYDSDRTACRIAELVHIRIVHLVDDVLVHILDDMALGVNRIAHRDRDVVLVRIIVSDHVKRARFGFNRFARQRIGLVRNRHRLSVNLRLVRHLDQTVMQVALRVRHVRDRHLLTAHLVGIAHEHEAIVKRGLGHLARRHIVQHDLFRRNLLHGIQRRLRNLHRVERNRRHLDVPGLVIACRIRVRRIEYRFLQRD